MFTARITPSKIDWTTLNTLVAFHYGEVGNLALKFNRVEIKSYYHIFKKPIVTYNVFSKINIFSLEKKIGVRRAPSCGCVRPVHKWTSILRKSLLRQERAWVFSSRDRRLS